MKRYLPALSVLLISHIPVMAQDIPLSKILVANENWKEVAKAKEFSDPKVVATSRGRYQIAADSKSVVFIAANGQKDNLQLKTGAMPTCLTLWSDSGHIVIGLTEGAYLWAVRLETDGTFGPGDRYYSLRTSPDQRMHVSAMTMDAAGLLYACTPLGIQIFDPTGRLCGVVPGPTKEPMTNIAMEGNQLLVACGNLVFARKIQGKAIARAEK